MVILQLTLCLIITLNFSVQSFKIYKIDNENDWKTQLKNILLKTENKGSSLENQQAIVQKYDGKEFETPSGKSVFVKRIIPHGYKSGKYEYDPKLKTLFKPQIRFHIKKPIDQHENEIIKSMELDDIKDGSNSVIVIVKRTQGSEKKEKRTSTKDLVSRQIKKLLKYYVGKGKKKFKKRFRSLLDAIRDSRMIKDSEEKLGVRQGGSQSFVKSGEVHDPYAPGKVPGFLEKDKVTKSPKQKKFYPEYPYWNWWTYKKTIVQDKCKGGLVMNGNSGNVCVNKVGHRRNIWNTIKDFFKGPKDLKNRFSMIKKNPKGSKKETARNGTVQANEAIINKT